MLFDNLRSGHSNWFTVSWHRTYKRETEEELPHCRLQCVAEIFPIDFACDLWLETQVSVIEAAFEEFTERKDVAILLVNQHVSFHSPRSFSLSLIWSTDCGEDSTNGREVQPSIPCTPRDTVQGSSIRLDECIVSTCDVDTTP